MYCNKSLSVFSRPGMALLLLWHHVVAAVSELVKPSPSHGTTEQVAERTSAAYHSFTRRATCCLAYASARAHGHGGGFRNQATHALAAQGWYPDTFARLARRSITCS